MGHEALLYLYRCVFVQGSWATFIISRARWSLVLLRVSDKIPPKHQLFVTIIMVVLVKIIYINHLYERKR